MISSILSARKARKRLQRPKNFNISHWSVFCTISFALL
jgi:hypothetical protein